MSATDRDDLFALCGVTLPFEKKERKVKASVEVGCGHEPPREKPRFTEWSNIHTFTSGGYIARVFRTACSCCESLHDTVEGIFILELHEPSGTRRMTRLDARGTQFPMGMDYAKEVTEVQVEYCGECIGDLGFNREVDSRGLPYTLAVGEGRVK